LNRLILYATVSLVLILSAQSAVAHYPRDFSQPITRIGLGSCNRQDAPQPQWSILNQHNLDLWLWLGDNIYADTEDMEIMRSKYDEQFNREDYAEFRKAVPVVGTWDDHDYGENDSGKWYPKKRESQRLLLDFLEEPDHSPRRSRDGAYAAYTFGPPARQVKFILLDNRYFADKPGPEADILGESQWDFLHTELNASTAQFTFVGSGTQVLALDQRFENWGNFPQSRRRLLEMIRESRTGGVILLSGDRHIHEISVVNDESVRYPLIDFTASGLTHSYSSLKAERNRYRVGPLLSEPGFALIVIDWEQKNPTVSLQARDMNDNIRLRLDMSLSSLQPNKDLDNEEGE
jgi:alkaline phosphatase D